MTTSTTIDIAGTVKHDLVNNDQLNNYNINFYNIYIFDNKLF